MRNAITRIGVLGCAKIARRSVIPAIKALPDEFQLVAVASRCEHKAIEFSREFQCEAVVGYDEIVKRDDIDALYIPLPSGLHYEWIRKAICAGKHVYAEKSFASTAAETRSLLAYAENAGISLMEGYMFLYHKQHAAVNELINNGEIGELRHFHGCFSFPPLPADDFRYDEVVGGGVLLDAAGYPLRAAHYFCGHSLVVQAATVFRDPTAGTSLWGSAFLADGRGLGASISFGFDNSYQCRYEIYGSKAKIALARAYTPGPSFAPIITLENAHGLKMIEVEPDNHFVGALREFRKTLLNPGKREQHYRDILIQSEALEDIKIMAKYGLVRRRTHT